MRITETPEEIFREYEKAVAYNQSIGLYENVEKNEDFYHDRQWGAVAVPGLDQPVGAAAINSVPRQMIEGQVRAACGRCGYDGGIEIIISIPCKDALVCGHIGKLRKCLKQSSLQFLEFSHIESI